MHAPGCPPGFARRGPARGWPRTAGAPRRRCSSAPVETLPGVGPAVRAKARASSGLETVGDVLAHRPRRYEEPAPERPIARALRRGGGGARGRRSAARVGPPARPAAHPHGHASPTGAARSARPGSTSRGSRRRLEPGTRVRLRGRRNRYGFAVKSYDLGDARDDGRLRARLPRERGARRRSSCARSPRPRSRTRARRGDPLPADAARSGRAAAAAPTRSRAPPAARRSTRPRRAAAGSRFDELLVLQLALARRAARARGGASPPPLPPPGELVAPLPRGASVHAHARAGARDRRDRRRPRRARRRCSGCSRATSARARRSSRSTRSSARVEAGRQGALMAPTETLAEQHFLTIEELCAELGVRVVLLTSALPAKRARDRAAAIASGDVAARGRHARADPARGRVRRPRRRGRRRAAPLRRRAARRARRGAQPARPAHDGDADPADARADGLRRPGRQRDRRAAGEPQADRHRVGDRGAKLRGVHAAAPPPRRGSAGVRRLPADRGAPRRPWRERRRTRRSGSGRASSAAYAVGLHARTPAAGRAPRGHARLQGSASSTSSSRRP